LYVWLQAISKARCLEKLSIYNNNIGTLGCQALTAAVAATPGLKVTTMNGRLGHAVLNAAGNVVASVAVLTALPQLLSCCSGHRACMLLGIR
jgi:hypothetical protein